MPQIILKERTAHLVSYTSFTRDVDQYQNTSTTINTFFTENLSLTTFVLLILQSFQKQLGTPPEAVACRCSLFLKVSQISQESTYVLVSF